MEKSQKRVGCYSRTNLPQVNTLKAYVTQNGFSTPCIFVYNKNGEETKTSLNGLLTLIRKNKIDVIITDSIFLFSRKAVEVSAICHLFQEHKVKIILKKLHSKRDRDS